MKKPRITLKFTSVTLGLLAFLPFLAEAQNFTTSGGAGTSDLANFVRNIVAFTNSVLLPAVLAIAFFVFVWGIFQYFIVGGANDEKKEQGKSLMIYATLGFVFIVIFWGLVNFLANTIGLGGDQIQKVKTPFNFGTGTGVGGS